MTLLLNQMNGFGTRLANRKVLTPGSIAGMSPTTTNAVKTATAMAYGASASVDRYVFVFLSVGQPLTSPVLTIDGITANILYTPSGAVYVFGAYVPTGTSGDVVLTTSNSYITAPICHLWSMTGAADPTNFVTDTITAAGVSPVVTSGSYNFSNRTTLIAHMCLSPNATRIPTMSSELPTSPSSGPFRNNQQYLGLSTQSYDSTLSGSITYGATGTWSGGGSGSSRSYLLEWL